MTAPDLSPAEQAIVDRFESAPDAWDEEAVRTRMCATSDCGHTPSGWHSGNTVYITNPAPLLPAEMARARALSTPVQAASPQVSGLQIAP